MITFWHKNKRTLAWATLPILSGMLFASLLLFIFKTVNAAVQTGKSVFFAETLAPQSKEDKYFYINKSEGVKPRITAAAYLVGDLGTGEIILSKNQETRFPIASVTKLMTAFLASELVGENDMVTVSKRAVATPGQNGELRPGEKIKVSELLYPLLMESSNDAAEALAEHFGRGDFIARMNKRARDLGLLLTSYYDPSGLSRDNQSTVTDLFRLAGHIRSTRPELFGISKTRSYKIARHNWFNTSKFLGSPSYAGGKSGFTNVAFQTGISIFNLPLARAGTRPIGIVLLKSQDRTRDVASIVQYLQKYVYYGGELDAATTWVEQKISAPPVYEPAYVNLSFMGDIMMDRGVESSVIKNFNGDFSDLFTKIGDKFLKNADIAFANLEGTASDRGVDMKSVYSFRMDPVVIPALAGAGFDVLSVANNHIGDWGKTAYTDTLARLKENEIAYTGGGSNELEAERPVVIEKNGMKVGFLGFSDVGPAWMEAKKDSVGQLLTSDPRFDEIIRNATAQVDFLVVSFHWGEEYKTKHNERQARIAHRAVDNGAKIIVGHHPHVAQDTEVYKNAFIAYSLGNFIFDQSWSKPTMQGMLLQIKLWKDGEMDIKKNTTYLNSFFQLDRILEGKEEKLKFQEIKMN